MLDYESPYANIPEEDRHIELARDVFGDEDWEPDDLVLECMEKYKQLTFTPAAKLLASAVNTLNKLERYFDQIDFDKTTKEGVPIYNIKEVISSLEKLGKLVASVQELRKQVDKERAGEAATYGDIELNEFNMGT